MRPFRVVVPVLSWLLLWSVGSAAPAREGFGIANQDRHGLPTPAPAAMMAELNADADDDATTGGSLAPGDAFALTVPGPAARPAAVIHPARRLFDRRAATLVGVVVFLD